MDKLTFIVEITKALAWPASILLVTWFFRSQVVGLLSRIKKGKVGPAEFEFEESVEILKEEVGDPAKKSPEETSDENILVSATSPRALIISAWLEVEKSMNDFLLAKGFSPQSRINALETIKTISNLSLIDKKYIKLTDSLRHLRNQATHDIDFNPSSKSVVDYLNMTKVLINEYRAAAMR